MLYVDILSQEPDGLDNPNESILPRVNAFLQETSVMRQLFLLRRVNVLLNPDYLIRKHLKLCGVTLNLLIALGYLAKNALFLQTHLISDRLYSS